MLSTLMSSRRFAPLFWCQAFSAFNDNFVKNTLVLLILYGVGSTAPAPNGGTLVTVAGGLLILPFLLLSGLGGELADRYDKARVARAIKLGEVGVAAVGALGYALHSVPILMLCVLGLGTVAALFGPIKYGILPDHLSGEELPAGNALVEGGTFLAILLGTIGGGLAMSATGDSAVLTLLMLAIALACWGSALLIPRTEEASPSLRIDPNILASTHRLLGALTADRRILGGAMATGWFWLAGSVVLALVPTLAKDVLGVSQGVVTLFLAAFSIGIGLGSVAAARLAAGRILLILAPVGAVLMGLFGLDAAWVAGHATPGPALTEVGPFLHAWPNLRLALDFALMAVAGGLVIVPTFAAVQAWAPPAQRARVVAAVNVLQALFIVAGAVVLAGLQALGLSTPWLLAGVSALTVLAGLAFFRLLPVEPLRDAILLVFRLFYRVEVTGTEHLAEGPRRRLIAINHVSFLDAPLMLAIVGHDPVFAIDQTIAKAWWVKPFLSLTRAFPLDPTKPMQTRSLINEVKAGNTLVIFPEGRLTVTGSLMKVYDGAGLIADRSDAVVVPVRIDGLEASLFSRLSSSQVRRRLFPKVRVTILEPRPLRIPADAKGRRRRQAAGAALYDVMSDLMFRTAPIDRTVFEAVLATSRRHGPGRTALEDPLTGALSYRKTLLGASVLAVRLKRDLGAREHVGVMLPNANGVAVTLLALHSLGCVPAMLNYTAGPANLVAALKAAEVRTVLVSRAFVDKAKLGDTLDAVVKSLPDLRLVWMEDIRKSIGRADKLRGFLHAGCPHVPVSPDSPAAILFTSGSEGAPKGVVLSHRNILANSAQALARIDIGPSDTLFNVMPVFHSFGLTGMVLFLVAGARVYLYPSPLHYRVIPELIYGTNSTVLISTDTFLNGYARTANAYDFRSLRYIVSGAEAVRAETRRTYNEKFGLRILEGYGVTETSPVVATNTPMFNRTGTVGRLMPGMEARLEPVEGVDEGGRLFLRGPNIMQGYLRANRPGIVEPPEGGWHDTGDIVTLDDELYISIKGRAKRFAKIAGEMVSLASVEDRLHGLWADAAVAVVAVKDARKGERLVLVTDHAGADRHEVSRHLKAHGATEMMVPSDVMVLDELPVLGTGKTDYVSIERMAREQAERKAASPAQAAQA